MTESDQKPFDGATWKKQISSEGEFLRRATTFRDWIRSSQDSHFPAVSSRYHLYVSYACPWAHRTLIVRGLKGLQNVISFDVTDWLLPTVGWTFSANTEDATLDRVGGHANLREIYTEVSPGYRGAVTVPTLWDKQESTIVNNESSEIIRMFNSEFNDVCDKPEVDLYPKELRSEIDTLNQWIYPEINNGVYQAGFARSQAAYEKAVLRLFTALDRAEKLLASRRYIAGDRLTEADVRLWTTLIRFDAVYLTHFKCNLRRLSDYPHLWAYTRELYAHPIFRETTKFMHIKGHYFESHESINPCRIVPVGPLLDYEAPHDRARLRSSWFPEA